MANLSAVGATTAAVLAMLAWVRWRPFRAVVEGDSMAPALLAGEWVLAVRTRPDLIRPGQVVVARPPSRPGLEVVKRVAAGPGELAPNGAVLGPGEWFLLGDQKERSTDSRHFGPVPAPAIAGRVVAVRGPSGWRRPG
ncbi:MAG: S26 family signal peptidase [Actinobacteria bacterium]|nr:S26 family signal peptidase [Actinomycetota bacterium]